MILVVLGEGETGSREEKAKLQSVWDVEWVARQGGESEEYGFIEKLGG